MRCGKLPDLNKFTHAFTDYSSICYHQVDVALWDSIFFFFLDPCIQDENRIFNSSRSPVGLYYLHRVQVESFLGAGAGAGACALLVALLRVSSIGDTARTCALPGALGHVDDIPALWQMVVGSPFNLGHLHMQASFLWLLPWYWRCPHAPSTGSALHTGALRSALVRWCLGQ